MCYDTRSRGSLPWKAYQSVTGIDSWAGVLSKARAYCGSSYKHFLVECPTSSTITHITCVPDVPDDRFKLPASECTGHPTTSTHRLQHCVGFGGKHYTDTALGPRYLGGWHSGVLYNFDGTYVGIDPSPSPPTPISCNDFTVPGGSCVSAPTTGFLMWTDRDYDYGGNSAFSADGTDINLFDGSWKYAKFGHDTPRYTGTTQKPMSVVIGCHYYASHTGTTDFTPVGASGDWKYLGKGGVANRPSWQIRYYLSSADAGQQNIGCSTHWHVGPFFASPRSLAGPPEVHVESWSSFSGASFLKVTVKTASVDFTTLRLALQTDAVLDTSGTRAAHFIQSDGLYPLGGSSTTAFSRGAADWQGYSVALIQSDSAFAIVLATDTARTAPAEFYLLLTGPASYARVDPNEDIQLADGQVPAGLMPTPILTSAVGAPSPPAPPPPASPPTPPSTPPSLPPVPPMQLTVDTVRRTWADAKLHCEESGGALVSIRHAHQNALVVEALRAAGVALGGSHISGAVWLGGTDSATEGTWVWADGSTFFRGGKSGAAVDGAYVHFENDEPNNSASGVPEHCLQMRNRGGWNDAPCDTKLPSVCSGLPASFPHPPTPPTAPPPAAPFTCLFGGNDKDCRAEGGNNCYRSEESTQATFNAADLTNLLKVYAGDGEGFDLHFFHTCGDYDSDQKLAANDITNMIKYVNGQLPMATHLATGAAAQRTRAARSSAIPDTLALSASSAAFGPQPNVSVLPYTSADGGAFLRVEVEAQWYDGDASRSDISTLRLALATDAKLAKPMGEAAYARVATDSLYPLGMGTGLFKNAADDWSEYMASMNEAPSGFDGLLLTLASTRARPSPATFYIHLKQPASCVQASMVEPSQIADGGRRAKLLPTPELRTTITAGCARLPPSPSPSALPEAAIPSSASPPLKATRVNEVRADVTDVRVSVTVEAQTPTMNSALQIGLASGIALLVAGAMVGCYLRRRRRSEEAVAGPTVIASPRVRGQLVSATRSFKAAASKVGGKQDSCPAKVGPTFTGTLEMVGKLSSAETDVRGRSDTMGTTSTASSTDEADDIESGRERRSSYAASDRKSSAHI